MSKVRIEERIVQEMIQEARLALPLECCGLLAGVGGVIDEICPTANQRASATSFAVPAPQLIRFMKDVRRRKRQFLGIYHSHPEGPALPSARDEAEFFYPEVSYWILAFPRKKVEIRCFRWGKMGFQMTDYELAGHSPAGNPGATE